MCHRLSGDFPVFRVSISPMPFPGAYSQMQFRHDVLEAGFPADRVFCGRNEGEIGHIRCGGWRQYGYIYEKERSRLAKIEKMAEALEKKLIFLPKNDSL